MFDGTYPTKEGDPAEQTAEPGHPEFLKLLDEMRSLHQKKAADYGRGEDPLANCRAAAEFGIPPWVGVALRLNDKLHRVKSFVQNGSLKNESIEDSFLDLAAYAAARLRAMPQVEMIAEPELSLLAFRIRAPGRDERAQNQLNERVLELVNSRRRVFLSPTMLSGRIVLRICVLSFRTHRERIEACLEDLAWAIEQATK